MLLHGDIIVVVLKLVLIVNYITTYLIVSMYLHNKYIIVSVKLHGDGKLLDLLERQ